MDLDHAQTHSIADQGRPRHTETRLHGYQLVPVRLVCFTLSVLSVGLFIADILSFIAYLHQLCTGAELACQYSGHLTPGDVQRLHGFGLSLDFYAIYTIVITSIFALGYWLVAALLFWRKSDDRVALLATVSLATFPMVFNTPLINALPSPWSFLIYCIRFLGAQSLGLFIFLFLSGHFVPRWTRWVLIAWLFYWGLNTFSPFAAFNPFSVFTVLGELILLGPIGMVVVVQIYRYRRVSSPVQRQQTKWVVYGISVGWGGYLVIFALSVVFPSLFSIGSLGGLIEGPIVYGLMLLLPLCIGFAVLRSRLWDIDVIINRTLVYVLLTACVVAFYVLVVVGLGALLQSRGNLLVSLLATGLVAVLFQPLRQRLQLAVNRLMYGERDTPYRVISRLGQRLEAALATDAVLPTIVETVAQALKLPYAAITLKQEDEVVIAASYGTPQAGLTHLPLLYQSEPLGELVLAPRGPGESFTPADRALLSDLARQAGVAAHAVRLTSDLQRLALDVQRSREHLVTAREEERRRLRRDLHDGLGPTLATITVKAEAASDAITAEPAQTQQLLEELIEQAQTAIGDIRRLVYNLRPPALDDLGLVVAIRAQALHYDHPGLHVSIVAPQLLPELSAAVEVAAYRIVQESLTNVVHHADARSCLIRLTCDGALHLEITDDGCGIAADKQAGVGLRSMQERAEEVGGTCVVEALPDKGTRVRASLPVSVEVAQRTQEPVSSFPEVAPVEE